MYIVHTYNIQKKNKKKKINIYLDNTILFGIHIVMVFEWIVYKINRVECYSAYESVYKKKNHSKASSKGIYRI